MIQALPEAVDARSDPTEGPRRRGRRIVRRWVLLAVVALLLVAVSVANVARGYTNEQMHLRNRGLDGAMALAEVLEDRGVTVVLARQLADLRVTAGEDTTLFVPSPAHLTEEEWDEIRELPADLVVAGTPYVSTHQFTGAISSSSQGSTDPLLARCEDPDAAAATRISAITGAISPTVAGYEIEFCFPTGSGENYGYAVWEEDGRTVRYIADRTLLSNARLASDGNAALGLRALGHHADLVWYQPTGLGAGVREPGTGLLRTMPPATGPVLLLAAGVAALGALWRGKRMGPVVTEALPVVVRPGEAVHGRGRLYHRAGSTGHAAAGLRAGTARRLAKRLGLNRAAAPEELVAAIAAASGLPQENVGVLLYGPPPTTSAALVRIAAELKELEDSVS
nr:DUF4350 domain-containing protein [Actinomycetales bacterium]